MKKPASGAVTGDVGVAGKIPGNRVARTGNIRAVDSPPSYAEGTGNPTRGAQDREVLGRDFGINREGETNFKRGSFGESLPLAGTAIEKPDGPVVQRAARLNRETGTQYPDYDAVRQTSVGDGNTKMALASR